MFSLTSRARSWLACACLVTACPIALAQAGAGAERIVVTAARIEQALADALPSTRLITRAEIEATQAADLPSLLRALTSIDVAQTGPVGSQASLFLRGADSRQTLVLIDGVPFARADTGSSSWQYVPLDQIERVEIVRGNLSSLFGAQAVGGVVRIVTRQAETPSASLAVGSQGTWRGSVAAGTRWGEGATATRLSGSLSTQRSDGYSGYSARDPKGDPGVNPDRDGAAQHGANVRVDQGWATGHQTRVALTTSRTRSDYDGFDPTASDVLTTRVQAVALTTQHALGAGVALQAEAGRTSERFDDPTGFTLRGDSRVRNLAAALAWSISARNELQLGVESRRDRFSEPGVATRERDTHSTRLGWQGRPLDGWQLQAHARHDRSRDFGNTTTGLLGAAYAFAPGWKASASWSTGFSAPSFSEQAFDADPTTPLRAERSRQAELALQWQESAATVRAALFVQRQRDRIDFDPITFDATNIARARNRGFELMAQGPWARGTVSGELTLQDPRNADTDTALLRRAKHSLALAWNGVIESWELRAGLRHTGARRDFDPVSFGTATNPARTTLALGVARAVAPGWRVAATLDNAFDSKRTDVLGYTAPPRALLVSLQGSVR